MVDSPHPARPGARFARVQASLGRFGHKLPTVNVLREMLLLCAVTVFVLLYGLVPLIGGDQLGLVGADEPRYAQIAREMLFAVRDRVQGAYLMPPLGKYELALEVLDGLKR